MPAGVVHDLELVEIEEHDGVRAVLRFGEAEQIVEAVLELAAVQEPGERIVARPPGELPRQGARARHVGND